MARTKNPNSERIFEDGKYFNKEKYEQGIKNILFVIEFLNFELKTSFEH